MSETTRAFEVRERVRRLLGALAADDLEERIAPVKCSKHPDHAACYTGDYAVPFYAAPEDEGGSD